MIQVGLEHRAAADTGETLLVGVLALDDSSDPRHIDLPLTMERELLVASGASTSDDVREEKPVNIRVESKLLPFKLLVLGQRWIAYRVVNDYAVYVLSDSVEPSTVELAQVTLASNERS